MTAAAAIEVIRAALHALENTSKEVAVIRASWSHQARRRPESLFSLGEAFERNPTEPIRDRPPEKR